MKTTIKKGLTKEVNVFQKSVPIAAIFLVAMVATGSAALLMTYGSVTGNANVQQSVTIDGNDHETASHYGFSNPVAGTTDISLHELENNADVAADVILNTTCSPDQAADCEGVETDYMVFTEDQLLEQDQEWGEATANVVTDDKTGKLAVHAQTSINDSKYDAATEAGPVAAGVMLGPSGTPTFDGSNTVSVDYRIGDGHHDDRQAPDWIAYIVTATSDVTVDGETINAGDKAVVIDATVDGDGETVDFQMGAGALVFPYGDNHPYENITSGDLMNNAEIDQVQVATGTDAVYGSGTESDLYYFDVRLNGDSLFPDYTPGDSLTLDAGSTADLAIKTAFNVALEPDTYSLTTTVSPDNN